MKTRKQKNMLFWFRHHHHGKAAIWEEAPYLDTLGWGSVDSGEGKGPCAQGLAPELGVIALKKHVK